MIITYNNAVVLKGWALAGRVSTTWGLVGNPNSPALQTCQSETQGWSETLGLGTWVILVQFSVRTTGVPDSKASQLF